MSEPLPGPEWSRLSALVDALLDAPPERRAALIEELSAGDPNRRAELERLVADIEREAPLLARPAADRFARLLEEQPARSSEVLADRYRLTREVARGGMATVYLARDLRHARDVAVKIVHPALAAALGSERFLREIAIVAQMHHPHIVPLFDSGDADGALYYVMPFEPGQSLRQRLARDGPLPLDDAVTILRDVCDALAYAHERGIVHRDIKPDNVMLTGRHAMVTDFGVASDLRDTTLTQGGASFGTPAYMAPEQIARDPGIDHRADIYAVGALAYELLAGRPPFVSESREALLSAHLSESPAPIVERRPDVPPALAEVVMRCLAKQPADRWQSAHEVVERLERLAPTDTGGTPVRLPWTRRVAATAVLGAIAVVAVVAVRQRRAEPNAWRARWAASRVERLTDFPGTEVDAAISADGQLVAFLADRDTVFDAFVTRVGSGQFRNLTGGRIAQLLNEDVRNVGFDGDGTHVWLRVADMASPANSVVSLVSALGGPLRPFLATSVMAAWSPDGSRIAYHETTAGDPIFVADRDGRNARRIYIGQAGTHCHHLSWAPDGRQIYFSYGVPPNEMDVWRVPAAGGPAERVTAHDSKVGYPVMLDDRTLIYTATDDDETGPWLYAMDLVTRAHERVMTGVEHYISIAAAAEVAGEPRRLAATVSNPTVGLWSIPITSGIAGEDSARSIALPTARSAAPRFGPDGSLVYLASRSGADGVWRLTATDTVEVWRPDVGAVVGALGISPDGSQMCFPIRHQGRSTLNCMSSLGKNPRALARSLDVRGPVSWSPDGRWIAVGAKDGSVVRLFKIPLDGGPPVRLVDSVSSNPVWSPNGDFIVYSGTPRARSVPVRAVTPDGRPYPLPDLTVDRVGDSYRFLPGGKSLVVKDGGFRRQNFSLVDLATGQRRRLTALRPGEQLHRFDVSPDGKRIVFERVRENSDIALITLPPR